MENDDSDVLSEELKARRDKIHAMLHAGDDLEEHLTSIVKSRKFTITGDSSHMSVKFILGLAENIDKARTYDWQSPTVNEDEFLRNIMGMLPQKFMTFGDTSAAIAGTAAVTFDSTRDYKCYDCAKPIRLTLKGSHIHLDCETVCENNADFYVDIDFPTGEVVYGDWPDRFSEIRDEGYIDDCDDGESINYIKGQRQRTEGYAKQGIFHLSVGNSSPTWYYNEMTAEIVIGSKGYDEETDEPIIPAGYKKMGYFCTDLWWVTMLDRSRYDEMISKLPKKRTKKYYNCKVETAHIKPGRYRFFLVPANGPDDDYTRVFAEAQYLGPCGEVPKVKHISEGRVILTPRQMVIRSAARYPALYSGQFEEVRFKVMDQIFNVLGNGIRSKSEFLAHISVPTGTVISNEMPPENAEKTKWDKMYVRTPYPNFQKKYSLVGEVPLENIRTDWLEEMEWFYMECQKFFAGENVNHYPYAFPSSNTGASTVKEWTEIAERRTAEAKSPEEFQKAWVRDYESEYHGDIEDFLTRRWAKKLSEIETFITGTIDLLHGELTNRKVPSILP